MPLRPVLIALLAVACSACGGVRGSRAPAPVRALRHEVDSLLAQPMLRNALLGVLVVDPVSGDTLVSHNAGKLFMPASNQKLLTGAVALTRLGPDFRFSTLVVADGAVEGGVLRGDLRVDGFGDPGVSDHMAGDAMAPMRAMADSLAARGITRITGALIPGIDAFPDAPWGFGWSWDDLDFPYSAGVDELFFNEGFLEVDVIGGAAPGAPVRVRVRPLGSFPVIRSLATTAALDSLRGGRARLALRHDSTDASLAILEGRVAPGDSQVVTLAYRDQPRAYLEALRAALQDRGISVDGGVSPRRAPRAGQGFEPRGAPLFSMASAPLAQVLAAFEKPSQNQIGEILLKTLGRSFGGAGTADSGARVVRDQLLAWGAQPDGFQVRDGSGLSRYNVVSPETIIRVLDAMRRSPHFTTFRDALPIAGVDGTIGNRMKGTPMQGNVHAKTGTLNMVRALSGYVTTAGGRPLLVSLLANHFTVPAREVDALHEAILLRLTRLAGGR